MHYTVFYNTHNNILKPKYLQGNFKERLNIYIINLQVQSSSISHLSSSDK